jgi:ADP-heptose:LPS heptosyltransferase
MAGRLGKGADIGAPALRSGAGRRLAEPDQPPYNSSVMRLLFITATRIGDAVLSTGLLRHLIERHSGARVTVAVGRVSAPLFQALPGLERILAIDKRPFKRHWLELWAAVAFRRWDLIVDLRASAIAYVLPARRRLTIGKRDPARHRVEELGALLGLDPPPSPTVWLAPEHEAAAARLVPAGAPVLAIGPAANWAGKQWRAERFAELARRLTAPGGALADARIAVLGAGHERAQAEPLIDALPRQRVLDLVGAVDLPGAAACLKHCRLVVGNDSGLMHLAAAAGAPTLGLFGPSPDRRYAPWGPRAAFVRSEESCEALMRRVVPPGRVQETLMDGLSVEAALAAATELLRRTGTPYTKDR